MGNKKASKNKGTIELKYKQYALREEDSGCIIVWEDNTIEYIPYSMALDDLDFDDSYLLELVDEGTAQLKVDD